jgi:mRNA interferase MazF
MIRGDIFWAVLGDPLGSEPGFIRPVFIVQSDLYNRSRLNTVIIVPLTSNTSGRRLPGCVLVTSDETGLGKDAVVQAMNVSSVDRGRMAEQVGHLGDATMAAIDRVLLDVLGL